jgi:hypothetical protein
MMKLHNICKDYYTYIDHNKYIPSQKIQFKIMKRNGLMEKKYYPLESTCSQLEHLFNQYRNLYR